LLSLLDSEGEKTCGVFKFIRGSSFWVQLL
jgi:hypothetical protein